MRVCLCARVRESAQALCVSKCGLPVFHLQAAGVKDGVRENVGLQDGRDPAANEARHTERSKIHQSRALSCSCPQLARTTNLTPLHVFNDVPFVSAPQADFLSRCFCAQLDISHIHTKRKWNSWEHKHLKKIILTFLPHGKLYRRWRWRHLSWTIKLKSKSVYSKRVLCVVVNEAELVLLGWGGRGTLVWNYSKG